MAIHSIRDTGGEPNTWKVKLFAHISGSEEFVAQLMMEMPELLDASMIYGDARDKLREAILDISIKGLMPAFECLKTIRSLSDHAIPELNRRQLYENFTLALWRSYGDLMQKAAKMMEPGFGFLFQNDAKFEKGLVEWKETRPRLAVAAAPYLRKQRAEWQGDLNKFRNYLEHGNDANPAVFDTHYEPTHAEKLFEQVWRTIADILAMLVSLHLSPRMALIEIPPAERDPVHKRRFRYAVRGLTHPRE